MVSFNVFYIKGSLNARINKYQWVKDALKSECFVVMMKIGFMTNSKECQLRAGVKENIQLKIFFISN